MTMQDESTQDYFETSDGAVRIWIEQGSSIQIRAMTEHHDPVELSASEALEVANVLQKFTARL
ncbi:hypothetical protein CTN06_11960 [Pectobacterium zantedeschiae]|uniref:Uncharacterized protein n=2 Tax=Pectobacterium zantedeschiae TaxID=2034769 RepID=A0A9X8P6A2_9GAMM|nr:hypothetical protein CTN06_20115 [Pectobacterium zantedeschiae]RYC42072.1 hypothetical protein CTN06_11960 [Pectobacterium zantedeschiae]RYC45309.1 hypothetical protein CLR69_10080 [Pectobacterium zantedeschiae]